MLDVVGIDRLQTPIDFGSQVVVVEKPLIRRRGNHESRRHPQANGIADFAQVGHLAADDIGHVLVDLAQGQDEPLVFHRFFLREDLIDRLLNLIEALHQFIIFSRCQKRDFFDHPKDVDGNCGGAAAHERHAEGALALQGQFDVGHDVQGLVVGADQLLEVAVALLEIEAQGFDLGRLQLFFGGKKPFDQVAEEFHIRSFPAEMAATGTLPSPIRG